MSTPKLWFSRVTTADILAVAMVDQIGSISWRKLFDRFDSLTELLGAPVSKIVAAGITEHQAGCLLNRPRSVEAGLHLLKTKNIKVVTIDSPHYPTLLKEIDDPPLWLFTRGDLKTFKKNCLTVVGTRKPSHYALNALEGLLPEAICRKLCLVSGLAYGVDKHVHQLAIKYHSSTIAVLAGGLDSIYPADHHRLAEQIVSEEGLLVSEYPPLSRPHPGRFPIRNRIIAGLSRATMVVEAAIKSGSLTTAKAALDYNREVLAVPADITRRNAGGTNYLIKQGATLLDEPHQLFELYGLKTKTAPSAVDNEASQILHLLAGESQSAESLAQLTKRPIAEILGILTLLELGGRVFQPTAGQYLAKK